MAMAGATDASAGRPDDPNKSATSDRERDVQQAIGLLRHGVIRALYEFECTTGMSVQRLTATPEPLLKSAYRIEVRL